MHVYHQTLTGGVWWRDYSDARLIIGVGTEIGTAAESCEQVLEFVETIWVSYSFLEGISDTLQSYMTVVIVFSSDKAIV